MSNILATPGSNVCSSLDVSNAGMTIIIRSAQKIKTVSSYRYAAIASRSYSGCSHAQKEQHSVLQVPYCQSLASETVMPKRSYSAIPSDLIVALEPGHGADREMDL